MQMKAKYKGPIVSRYCAAAGKIKVAGPRAPWALPPETSRHTHTHTHSTHSPRIQTHTRAHEGPRSASGDPVRSRTALDVSLIFINDGEFEFLHR